MHYPILSASWKNVLLFAAALGVAVTTAHAQVTFTVQATANASALGYTSGQLAVFTFTLAPSFPHTAQSIFDASTNGWSEIDQDVRFNSNVPILWSAVTGTGLSGGFNPLVPTGNVVAHSSGPNSVGFSAFDDAGATSGLSAYGNSLQGFMTYNLSSPNFPSFATGSYSNPADYFSTYSGTYALSAGTITMWGDHYATEAFTVTSLTIAAVPEPSTYAALFGFVALGFAAYCRQRRQAG